MAVFKKKEGKIFMNRALFFVNSEGKERLIDTVENESEAMKSISKFLDEHKFKSYYTRMWRKNDHIVYDVGSHTEFFHLYD